MLESSEGYDRSYLSEGQKLYEEERERCTLADDSAGCRAATDERRIVELESWKAAQKSGKDSAKEPMLPPDPNLAAIDAQR
jgi:hypothetical protein